MTDKSGGGKLKLSHNISRWSQNERRKTMAMRSKTRSKVDRAIFHQTGSTTKAININPRPMRGGIRL